MQIFRLNARTWIEESLTQKGIIVTGEIVETHVRPWSTMLRVPSSCGDVFFKAVTPVFAFEPPLTEALYDWRPDCVIPVYAVDSEHGWMLTADGGRTLRAAFKEGLAIMAWEEVLALYAGLQIDLAGHIDELLAMGVRDRREPVASVQPCAALVVAQYGRQVQDANPTECGDERGVRDGRARLTAGISR